MRVMVFLLGCLLGCAEGALASALYGKHSENEFVYQDRPFAGARKLETFRPPERPKMSAPSNTTSSPRSVSPRATPYQIPYSVQQQRDVVRKQILEAELYQERAALAQTQAAIQAAPHSNVLKEKMLVHQSNISAIYEELKRLPK